MIRVVFDTNILYSAVRRPEGLPARAVNLIAEGLVIPCHLLEEYRDVLYRPKLDLHSQRRHLLLDLFLAVALHVVPTVELKISDDEDDNRIYECAAEALASFIVTGNTKHFPRPYLPMTPAGPFPAPATPLALAVGLDLAR